MCIETLIGRVVFELHMQELISILYFKLKSPRTLSEGWGFKGVPHWIVNIAACTCMHGQSITRRILCYSEFRRVRDVCPELSLNGIWCSKGIDWDLGDRRQEA